MRCSSEVRLLLTVILLSSFALADTLELKTGEHVEGAFKQATAAGAVIEVGGQAMTFPLDKVKAMYFGNAKPESASTPSPLREAIDALGTLRTTTSGLSVNLADYSSRVTAVKIIVEKYVRSDKAAAGGPVDLAMRYYDLAAQALSTRGPAGSPFVIVAVGKAVETPELTCPAIRAEIAKVPFMKPSKGVDPIQSRAISIGSWLSSRPNALWQCASEKLGEAESTAK